jgi:hypothetical protein
VQIQIFERFIARPRYNKEHKKHLLKFLGQRMGRCKARPSPKKQDVNTLVESSVLDMPHEEEKLDVNEFKGSNQITNKTRVFSSND